MGKCLKCHSTYITVTFQGASHGVRILSLWSLHFFAMCVLSTAQWLCTHIEYIMLRNTVYAEHTIRATNVNDIFPH